MSANMTPEMIAMLAQMEQEGTDESVAKAGGSGEDFLAPAGKNVRSRLIEFIELGKHEGEWEGKKRVNDKVELAFELSGKGYEPREHDGKLYPYVVRITINKSQGENSAYFKIFNRCRTTEKQLAQMIGGAFLLDLEHSKPNSKGKVYCNIVKTEKCPNIKKAVANIVDPETDEVVEQVLKVAPPISPLKLFVWNFATPAAWDALFIDGEYPAKIGDDGAVITPAQSKNKIQNTIRAAINFKGSPIFDYANGSVTKDDSAALADSIGTANKPERIENPNAPTADDLMGDIG